MYCLAVTLRRWAVTGRLCSQSPPVSCCTLNIAHSTDLDLHGRATALPDPGGAEVPEDVDPAELGVDGTVERGVGLRWGIS